MKMLTTDPKADKGLADQDKNVLPEPENNEGEHAAEATEFVDDDLRMVEQPFEKK